MKKLLLISLFSMVALAGHTQLTYTVADLGPLPIVEQIDPMEEVEDYHPVFVYHEAPHPDGGRYTSLKRKVAERFPRTASGTVTKRAILPNPELISGFENNDPFGGIPSDNSFAVNREGVNISVVNSNLHMRDANGDRITNRSLQAFSGTVAIGAAKFDPRVIYDPQEDRFIMVWLAGTDSGLSTLVLAFSSTSNVEDDWNLYEIEGSPVTDQWSDYPMISITDKELFFTVNLIEDDESWQDGFRGTLIYQIDKLQAYAGQNPNVRMWSDIRFNGEFIRNLHPVKAADEQLHSDMYFLSNRNFDLQNDSIFILNINSDQYDADVALDIQVRTSDVAYGAPPTAIQPNTNNTLATNDARILDAFRLGNLINFVSNTVDPATGKAAIYHGKVKRLSTTMDVTGTIVTHPTRDLGYPAMAWTGRYEGDDEAIIVSQFSSETEFPGVHAIFTAWDDYSEWETIVEGVNFIDLLTTNSERWGDYLGCQRMMGVPGEVWATGGYGGSVNYRNRTTILTKPLETSVHTVPAVADVELFPNPTPDRVTIRIEINSKDKLQLGLYNNQGQLVEQFFNDRPKKIGELEFSFDLGPLASGVYYFVASQGSTEIISKKVVKG